MLEDLYYTPSNPASFGGLEKLKKAAREKGISDKELENWISQQDTYTLHKPIRRNYQRNLTKAAGIDDQWQADLVDMKAYKKYNNGYAHIMTVIDIFSKYAWTVPLKNKTGVTLVNALKSIFQTGRKPIKFNSDQGTEFENQNVRAYFKKTDVHFFTTRSDKKAAVVERFNRTLKTKMWRYFTYKNTYKYINVLKDLTNAYNNSRHRMIGMTPAQVGYHNEEKVYLKLYGKPVVTADKIRYKFEIGDTVRIGRQKGTFEKGYLPNWTEEIFTIAARFPRHPPVYKIKDYLGEVIEGTFYEQELQKTEKKDNVYLVEKIMGRKTQGGRKYVLVKWSGYPASMNSWISETDLIQLPDTA